MILSGPEIVAHAEWLLLGSMLLSFCGWGSLYASWRWDARTKLHRDAHARDAAFVMWARLTILSVTDHQGRIYVRSLYEMQDEPDRTWVTPVAVAVFRSGGPDDVAELHHGHDQDEEDNARGRAA